MRPTLLTLAGIPSSTLPAATADPDPQTLTPFLSSILEEALPLIDSVAPKSTSPADGALAEGVEPPGKEWKSLGTKIYPASAGPVALFKRAIGGETWACRRSVHRDAQERGSAGWDELWRELKSRHFEGEGEWAGSGDGGVPMRDIYLGRLTGCFFWVVSADKMATWDCNGVTTHGQEDFTLLLGLVRHRIGAPILKDRTFPVLQVTCATSPSPSSSTPKSPTTHAASSAPDTASSSTSPPFQDSQTYSEFHIITLPITDIFTSSLVPPQTLAKHSNAVVASYASVERIRKLDDGQIEWIMATASDARGVLPMWVQTGAVPGQIAQDVPHFLAWVAKGREERRKGSEN